MDLPRFGRRRKPAASAPRAPRPEACHVDHLNTPDADAEAGGRPPHPPLLPGPDPPVRQRPGPRQETQADRPGRPRCPARLQQPFPRLVLVPGADHRRRAALFGEDRPALLRATPGARRHPARQVRSQGIRTRTNRGTRPARRIYFLWITKRRFRTWTRARSPAERRGKAAEMSRPSVPILSPPPVPILSPPSPRRHYRNARGIKYQA